MNITDLILNLIPDSSSGKIPWEEIGELFPSDIIAKMKETPQNPDFHGEGDVYTHTKMACTELIGMPGFYALPDRKKAELFLGTYLHDIGKIKATRTENGIITSPYHAERGSRIARDLLMRKYALGGTREMMGIRETICSLIKYHMFPVHIMDYEDPERKIREISAVGEHAVDFSWDMLCMLAEADTRGRNAVDIPEGVERTQFAALMAEEAGCLYAPFDFADPVSKRAYLSGRNVIPDQKLFDSTWGEAVIMSGLPGTGKDTWIKEHMPDLPEVSLDGIRRELNIRPTEKQGRVVQTAGERARMYLRNRQPFVWNATNLTESTRKKLVDLFEGYGAGVRIIYLETDYETRTVRNCARGAGAVPEKSVLEMAGKMVLPVAKEARFVEWMAV